MLHRIYEKEERIIMKKVINMYPHNRTILKEQIPLVMPLCISIEPSNLCNFRCVMCYHCNDEYEEEAKPIKNMDWECFEKILSDMKQWRNSTGKKIKLIKLYSLGEPLLHPRLCDMLREIKDADVCSQVEITTNGSLLTSEIARKLVDYGLDILRVSVYSVIPERNLYLTKSKMQPQKIREQVKYLREYREQKGVNKPIIMAKMIDTKSDENRVFEEFYTEIADVLCLDELMQLNMEGVDAFQSYYGIEDNNTTRKKLPRRVCRYPFTHLTIRSNGQVVVCCTDWLKETCVGDVRQNSLMEIWESKSLYEFRCNMIKERGINIDVCKYCEIPYRDLPEDNIDEFPIEKLDYKYDI